MARITRKQLDNMARTINDMHGTPQEPHWTPGTGPLRANIGCWHIHKGPGGRFSLDQMVNDDGATRSPLNAGHIPARDLYERMRAYIEGFQDAQRMAKAAKNAAEMQNRLRAVQP